MIKYYNEDLLKWVDDNWEVKQKILIPHVVNDIGAFGSGFAGAIARNKKVKDVQKSYFEWAESGKDFNLGECQFVDYNNGISFVNMVGQHGVGLYKGIPPIRYWALQECMNTVKSIFEDEQYKEIRTVKFGAGLAGGAWNIIEKMIKDTWGHIDVHIYYID